MVNHQTVISFFESLFISFTKFHKDSFLFPEKFTLVCFLRFTCANDRTPILQERKCLYVTIGGEGYLPLSTTNRYV